MSAAIKNVTLVGATGNVGAIALENFSSSSFNLQVLRRLGSKSTFPASIKVIDVDFGSVTALTAALQGQDAVVSTLPAEVADLQNNIIDAAIAAGVRRFVPTEYGSNIDNALARQTPVFAGKVKIQEYIKEKAAAGLITYTFVYTGPFLDWGIQHNFILNIADYKATLYNDGKNVFSTTNVGTLGRALVAILEHPEETKNRPVFLEDAKISQASLLAAAKKAAPEKPWKEEYVELGPIVKKAGQELAQGNVNFGSIAPFLHQSFINPAYGGNFETSDNELLGLGSVTEDYIVEQYKKILN